MESKLTTEYTTSTDCRNDDGVIVGLIDGIIAQLRAIRRLNIPFNRSILHAIEDLKSDEDLEYLLNKTM